MVSFVALLFLGYLSCAEARGDTVDEVSLNEIPQQLVNRAGRISGVHSAPQGDKAAASTFTQQTCQPDIHAVLRDMTALMTEQRILLQQTQQELRQTQQDLRTAVEMLTNSDSQIKGILLT